ncbi:hypothetical protein SB847_21460, partial [Bacillus sp. SIMBA_026]|uniref:hypothetical protein n=1 Tax=Bacillus sp. SIMBA_026 TaxID=3085769 RepID=UPI003979D9ED
EIWPDRGTEPIPFRRDLSIAKMNVTSLIWIVPYLVCGAFSHLFDDPLNHAVYVWLPSGIAVGAYLLTKRENWALLLLGFFAAQVV